MVLDDIINYYPILKKNKLFKSVDKDIGTAEMPFRQDKNLSKMI